ncbi:MAG: EF-P lysine aminoacylase EpmA [Patescibacteria group bacterium]
MDLEKLKARSQIVQLMRRWFDERGFLEMHTPRLVGLPGQEPYLEPFWTTLEIPNSKFQIPNSLPAALITSPEYMLKRLLAAGLNKIYDLGPCFRNNEPWDGTHDPEFLLLEWYRREAGVEDLMRDTEDMMRWVAVEIPNSKFQIPNSPFRHLTVEEAWKEYCGIELAPLLEDRAAMARTVAERGQTVGENDTWDDLFFKIFLSEIEPKLGQDEPTFLYRYPKSMAALARASADDPRWADRVELYAGGLELANGFAELCDENEQRARFIQEKALRNNLGKKIWGLDERFLKALPKMGNAAGIAFGVERFVMLLTGAQSINEILPASARERFVQ